LARTAWYVLENGRKTASLFTDLLNAALGEVDWHEIAEHFLTDVEKTEEEEVSQ
jgi:hypothetical protein